MENDVIEEIVKESENWKEKYVKLLIKICIDNGVGIEKLKKQEILEQGDLVIIAGGDQIMKNVGSSVNKTIGGVLRV